MFLDHLRHAVQTRLPKRAALGAALALSALAGGCGPEYPNCEEDGDCKENEFYVNQQCQQCRTDEHCGDGQQCNAGACEAIPGFCTTTSDCPGGEECVGQRCRPAPEPAAPAPEPEPEAAAPCEIKTVYFEFDSSTLESAARDAIAANAECLKERGLSSLRLTGHTDNRGTEEYNLALGDRRARAVMQYMTSLGVDSGKLSTASMGEEMSQGEGEPAWARDRKVEFQ